MALTKRELKQDRQNWWYWKERMAANQAELTEKSIKETERQLIKYYQSANKKVIGQFEKTYYKLLSTIREGKEPTPADLYKLDTYWQMQGQINRELRELGDLQLELLNKQFTEEWINIYEGLALPSGSAFGSIDKQMAQQMINSIWCADGKTWSERIWSNLDYLRETLNEGLLECVVTGKKPGELKNALQERFGVSFNNADMIVRTEMAHIQTQAAQKRYEDAGIEYVEVWADKDERRCEVCGKLHQKRFPIGAQMPIPAHPRCRCSVIPVIDD